MEYAVIQSGGKQYKVAPGQMLDIQKIVAEKGNTHVFNEVLLWVSDEVVHVGTPTVPNVTVSATVVEQGKGEKIRVSKYKSKVRYRRTTGFRAKLTRLMVDSIVSETAPKVAKTSPKKTVVKKKA